MPALRQARGCVFYALNRMQRNQFFSKKNDSGTTLCSRLSLLDGVILTPATIASAAAVLIFSRARKAPSPLTRTAFSSHLV